jgi:hypothetical protein
MPFNEKQAALKGSFRLKASDLAAAERHIVVID